MQQLSNILTDTVDQKSPQKLIYCNFWNSENIVTRFWMPIRLSISSCL